MWSSHNIDLEKNNWSFLSVSNQWIIISITQLISPWFKCETSEWYFYFRIGNLESQLVRKFVIHSYHCFLFFAPPCERYDVISLSFNSGSDLISRFRLRFLGWRRLANGFGFSRGGSCRKCPKFVDISHPSFLNIAIGGGIWDMSRVTIPVGTTTGHIWSWICWSGGIAWTIIFSKLFSVGITPEKSGTIGTCCFRGYAWLGYFLWFWSNLLGTLLVTRFLLGVRQKTFFA